MPPARGRTAANDLRTKDRTISREVQQAEKPIEFWHIMFTEEMLDLIVLHTNEKIQGQINDRIQETGSDEFIKKTTHLKLLDKVIFLFFVFLSSSVPVPNPDPPDPQSEVWIRILLCIRIRILLSSFINSKKNLDSYYARALFDFLSLKNDVNVPSKSNKQKKLC